MFPLFGDSPSAAGPSRTSRHHHHHVRALFDISFTHRFMFTLVVLEACVNVHGDYGQCFPNATRRCECSAPAAVTTPFSCDVVQEQVPREVRRSTRVRFQARVLPCHVAVATAHHLASAVTAASTNAQDVVLVVCSARTPIGQRRCCCTCLATFLCSHQHRRVCTDHLVCRTVLGTLMFTGCRLEATAVVAACELTFSAVGSEPYTRELLVEVRIISPVFSFDGTLELGIGACTRCVVHVRVREVFCVPGDLLVLVGCVVLTRMNVWFPLLVSMFRFCVDAHTLWSRLADTGAELSTTAHTFLFTSTLSSTRLVAHQGGCRQRLLCQSLFL